MRTLTSTISCATLIIALICGTPSVARAQDTVYFSTTLPYPGPDHFGGCWLGSAYVMSPLPPPEWFPVIQIEINDNSDEWIWVEGQPDYIDYWMQWADFNIEIHRNRKSSRTGNLHATYWFAYDYWFYQYQGEGYLYITQAAGIPSELSAPAEIDIPYNGSTIVTYATDMGSFAVQLKYRFKPIGGDWGDELTTGTYPVNEWGLFDVTYNWDPNVLGDYEFTQIRDSDDGTWQQISVPVSVVSSLLMCGNTFFDMVGR